MTIKHPKRPRDANQLAKSIVDLVTGNTAEPADDGKDPAAVGNSKLTHYDRPL